jgi:hypothetical protein
VRHIEVWVTFAFVARGGWAFMSDLRVWTTEWIARRLDTPTREDDFS